MTDSQAIDRREQGDALPEIQEAWAAHRGDTVFIRLPRTLSRDAWEASRMTCDAITEKTGVHIVLLDPGAEIVNPQSGETA